LKCCAVENEKTQWIIVCAKKGEKNKLQEMMSKIDVVFEWMESEKLRKEKKSWKRKWISSVKNVAFWLII
jgi:hypothetical protein